MPERLSVAAKSTVTALLFQPLGAEMAVEGAVRSIFSPDTVFDEELSARSETAPVADRSPPSPPTTESDGHAPAAIPDSVSAHAQWTVTSELCQPLGFAGLGVPEIVGGVMSISRWSTRAFVALPATSLTETRPVLWSSPSELTVVSAGRVPSSTPDVASVADQWTTTGERYQPAVFGRVVGEPARLGAVSSTL